MVYSLLSAAYLIPQVYTSNTEKASTKCLVGTPFTNDEACASSCSDGDPSVLSDPCPIRHTGQLEGISVAAEETPKRHDVAVQRIMWTGTIWFSATLLGIALFLGPLLAGGWRPTQLPLPLAIIWWVGAALTAASMALIGWSGCPILAEDVETEDRRKSRSMPLGVVFFLIGTAACLFTVMLS
jgi:hypothetical protein